MNTKNKLAEHKKNDVASLFFVLKKMQASLFKKKTQAIINSTKSPIKGPLFGEKGLAPQK